jgi:hypothetical protein
MTILDINIIIIIIIIIHSWFSALNLSILFYNLHHCILPDETYIAAGKQVVIVDANKIHKIYKI